MPQTGSVAAGGAVARGLLDLADGDGDDDKEGEPVIGREGHGVGLDDQHDAGEAHENGGGPAPAEALAKEQRREPGHRQRHSLHDRRQIGERHVHEGGDEEERRPAVEEGAGDDLAARHQPQMADEALEDAQARNQAHREDAAHEDDLAHRQAREWCFIANSVTTDVRVVAP